MVVWLGITLVLSVIGAIAVVNTLTFPRLRRQRPQAAPPISLLVPARNERAVIGETVRSLLAQDYPEFEVIVLDDQSEDGTGAIAQAAAADDPRFRLLSGVPLPPGWIGKNWACHQLAGAASGDILVFADADVRWQPDALAALVAQFERHSADLLAVWPTQITHTWGERLTVSLLALVVFGYLPELLVRRSPWASLAAANGQCLAFRREAYAAVGGHAAVRHRIVEDVALARQIKRQGRRLVMVLDDGLITCHMYQGWSSARDGFAKNIIAGYGGLLPLLLATIFHWLVFFAPWVWLGLGWALDLGPHWPGWPLALVALGVGVRALSAGASGQRMRDAVWMPVSVLLMTAIAARAIWWRVRYGGPRWKGRSILASKGVR